MGAVAPPLGRAASGRELAWSSPDSYSSATANAGSSCGVALAGAQEQSRATNDGAAARRRRVARRGPTGRRSASTGSLEGVT